jgi:hypothetical protein
MLINLSFSLFLLINLVAVILAADRFSRDDFPPGFVFGSGTSAYQVSTYFFSFVCLFRILERKKRVKLFHYRQEQMKKYFDE